MITKPKIKNIENKDLVDILNEEEFSSFEITKTPSKKIKLEDLTIDSCIFKGIDFNNIELKNIDLIDVVFENCDLSNKSFDNKLLSYNITDNDLKAFVRKDKFDFHRTDKIFLQICNEIRESFDRCITTNSDILQGCVWRINLEDIEKIEFLTDKNYRYGSLNYIRSNGKRMNWKKDFYKKLK